jgi:parallel beta-helix repeat protein
MNETDMNNVFVGNWVNGKLLGYFNGLTDKTIDASLFGQVVLTSCRNVVVENGVFKGIAQGSLIMFCKNCTLRNCDIYQCGFGVHLRNSDGTHIMSSRVHDNQWTGILFNDSSYCEVSSNEVYCNGINGIELSGSPNVAIINNSVHHNQVGLYLYSTSGGYVGYNTMFAYQQHDIQIVYDVTGYTFVGNSLETGTGSAAIDDGYGNLWDDGFANGNSWYPYHGNGTCAINGSAGSVDHFATQVNDHAPPLILGPSTVNCEYGENLNYVVWHAYDSFPFYYQIFCDGLCDFSGPWFESSGTILFNIQGLSLGAHTLNITAVDWWSNPTSKIIAVNVISASTLNPPVIDHPADIMNFTQTSGNYVTWNPSSRKPAWFVLYHNGSLALEGTWGGSPISVNIDFIGLGAHNLTLGVFDKQSGATYDTVWVFASIQPSNGTTSTTPTTPTTSGTAPTSGNNTLQISTISMAITIGSVGVILVVMVMIIRGRPPASR